MSKHAKYNPFAVKKHQQIKWRVIFPAGDLHHNKKIQKDFDSENAAKAFVKNFKKRKAKIGELVTELNPRAAADAVKAIALLPEHLSLEDAVLFTTSQIQKAQKSTTFQIAFEQFLKAKKEDDKISIRYMRNLKQTRSFFSAFNPRNLETIKKSEIKNILKNMPVSTSNLRLSHIKVFFNYCVSEDILEANPLLNLKPRKGEPKTSDIEIFTVEETQKFFDIAAGERLFVIPYFAILFFAGIRPEEAIKLEWQHLNAEYITIPESISKTGKLRYCPINETLNNWLRWFKLQKHNVNGRIFPYSEKTLERNRRELAHASNIRWIQDGARKSFASYDFATYEDEARTCLKLGHKGNEMLYRHYKKSVLKGYAEKYWMISPR
jgi:integrase